MKSLADSYLFGRRGWVMESKLKDNSGNSDTQIMGTQPSY